ncbi:hypothetical protein ABWED_1911 [Acinetobacter lwoffii]|nr:hypothetical protein ABWED_1911 [Acinetobacter lwoffii]
MNCKSFCEYRFTFLFFRCMLKPQAQQQCFFGHNKYNLRMDEE